MLRETARSLRWLFGILATLNVLIGIGAIAGAIIASREGRADGISPFFLTQVAFRLGIGVALAYVAVRLLTLLRARSLVTRIVIHTNFLGTVVTGAMFLLIGGKPNLIGVIISGLIYVYLLRAIDRLTREEAPPQNA